MCSQPCCGYIGCYIFGTWYLGDYFESDDKISVVLKFLLGLMLIIPQTCGMMVAIYHKANYKIEQEQSCPAVETPKDKDDKIKDVLKQIDGLEKEVASLKE